MATKPSCLYLPEEVIEQILVKVPCTKSILRCTLVCKLWYFLIKSSRFINTHLSGSNNTKFLLCQHTSACGKINDYSLYFDNEPSRNCVTLVFPGGLKHAKVHGSCNGVICYTKFREIRGNIYLWNPFVRKSKILPKFREKYYRKGAKETIGFWFDEEKSDYEVVKISYTTVASCVDVYSLRSNSWKSISISCPGTPYSMREYNVVYVNGTLHWLAEDVQGWRIVSLNMNNANFREALISTTSGAGGLYLTVVDDTSLVIFGRKGLSSVCMVKVHEDGLKLFYTDLDKRFDNQFCNKFFYLIGFRNNGEALLRLRNNTLFQQPKDAFSLPSDVIFSYDFGAKQLTDFSFDSYHLFSAHPFRETLVLLDESDVNVFGWKKMVGILKTSCVKILNCEWLDKS